ncbi:hypothetical protein AMECASPLE_038601 [Ameca splendens]|uniref:Uncharacterized protein n=1 Tax=Ameca splendens TaxID=208324 RepID=A0ABV0ZHV2_9TELE
MRLVFLKPFIWRAKNLNHCSSSSGIASEQRAGTSEDGMGGAAASLGDSAVADEDAGLVPTALTSADRETTSSPADRLGTPARRRFERQEEKDGLAAGTEAGR